MNQNSLAKKFWRLLVSVGPAFFLVGYTIGTGSIVSMASAGSRYGMTMLWALALACIFCFVLLEAFGRYSLITGEGALYGFRQHMRGGRFLAITLLAGLILVEVLALAGNMGILSDLIHEWTAMITGGKGWNTVGIAIGIALFVFGLIMIGKFSFFEKILIIFVSVMGISFLATMFIVMPGPQEMVRGLLPLIPEEANAPMIMAAMIGTTLTAPTFVVRSILMKEKKWDSRLLKHEKKDAAIGAFLMFLVSMSVMACAAGTLYISHQPVEKVVTMIALLDPLLGRFAVSVFVTGILGASLSSMIPILMLAPMLIGDYKNKPVDYRGPTFRILSGAALLVGLAVPVFSFRPVFAMLISQLFQVFLLPLVVAGIMYLLNRRDLMKDHKVNLMLNVGMVLTFLFALLISWQAVTGLIDSFHTMF